MKHSAEQQLEQPRPRHPYCSICGRYCDGKKGSAEEAVRVDGADMCGECADEMAEAFEGEGHDRSCL